MKITSFEEFKALAQRGTFVPVCKEIVADLLSSFAWIHLLTGRLEASEKELRTVVRLIVQGIKKEGGA